MRRQRARKQRKNIALALLALLCLGLIDILFLYIYGRLSFYKRLEGM